ncbi:MAG: type II secretion system minor pseudopilin GspK, partial [Desulfobacterales bacterium]|nr:type II secretion system minor pseudopilin GspK [Desulfobacterales bacterium]
VLVVTLLVTFLLAALVLSFSDETDVELSLSGFFRDNDLAYHSARSGVQAALAALHEAREKNEKEGMNDLGMDAMDIHLGEEKSVAVKTIDESGKVNLNLLVNAGGEIDEDLALQIRRLFRILGLGEERVDALLDWLDQDDIERMHGAEANYYRTLEQPYDCANGFFQTPAQFRLVKGFSEKDLSENGVPKDPAHYLTLYSDGKININTASAEVLQSLSERLDVSAAEAIIEYRKAKPFQSVTDLGNVPGLSSEVMSGVTAWLTVKSSAVSIEARGTYREASCTIQAVALMEEDVARPRLIHWEVR